MSTAIANIPQRTQKDFTRIPPYINLLGEVVNNDSDLLQYLHHQLEASKTFK